MSEPDAGIWIEPNPLASKADLEFISTTSSALFWIEQGPRPRNGSASFLNLGMRTFAVTAAHVIDGWRAGRVNAGARNAYLAGVDHATLLADLEGRIIDEDSEMDLATFSITDDEVSALGRSVVYGGQAGWPPPPLKREQGIGFSGYPGAETYLDGGELVFSSASQGLTITSVNDRDVLCQIERDKIAGVLGRGVPPDNFNFGGISGAAMFARGVRESGLLCWIFAGVVIQGPNTEVNQNASIPGFELIRGRRSHFIKADGSLDRELWAQATFTGR